jgi:hypothetical protein
MYLIPRPLRPRLHNRRRNPSKITRLVPSAVRARHSIDFVSVLWNGKLYGFTPTQARIVNMLWEARENGTPDVHQSTLLDRAWCESKRLEWVFRKHPAWGVVIIPSPLVKGGFRLANPGECPPPTPRKDAPPKEQATIREPVTRPTPPRPRIPGLSPVEAHLVKPLGDGEASAAEISQKAGLETGPRLDGILNALVARKVLVTTPNGFRQE